MCIRDRCSASRWLVGRPSLWRHGWPARPVGRQPWHRRGSGCPGGRALAESATEAASEASQLPTAPSLEL
eukprot:1481771-Alexandrium_andersonii.AAC.1